MKITRLVDVTSYGKDVGITMEGTCKCDGCDPDSNSMQAENKLQRVHLLY